MKKIILKTISIILLILSAFIVIINLTGLTSHFINLFNNINTITSRIILFGVLRILLNIIVIIYSLFIMLLQIRIIRLNKKEYITKKGKIIILFIPIIGIILQYFSLSDYIENILLMILLILEVIELLLITERKLYRRIETVIFVSYILVILSTILFSYKFCHHFELPTINHGTSTNGVITKNINSQIWQMSTEPEFYYNSFQHKKEKYNYNLIPIPGLSYTDTVTKDDHLRKETCTSMTPQGLVVTDKYIYVSAYCYTHEHNSVIYQIDKKTNKFIKTIILPDTSHVGGLAYDDTNHILWIATKKYNTSKDDTNLSTVSCITQDVIDNYDFEIQKQPIRYNKTYQTAFTNTSFMTYHDGYLYTGLFTKDENNPGITAKIKILEDGLTIDTEPMSYYYIPNYVQSIAFTEDKIIIVKSYSYKTSTILVYKNDEKTIDFKNTKPLKEITTYPMLEQIYPYDNRLYMIYESSAYAYRYTPGIKIDHIVNINNNILK